MSFWSSWRRLAAVALCVALTGCAAIDLVTAPGEGGIGGTGATAQVDHEGREGGIGGTGVTDELVNGPTGLFGVVTGLGSVHVNGRLIEVDPDLPVRTSLGVRAVESVTVGDVVAVTAIADDGDLDARDISVFYPLAGPVTRVLEFDSVVEVMGTSVVVEAGTPIVDGATGAALALTDLHPGDTVTVSGLWRGEMVVGARLVRINRPQIAVVSGLVLGEGVIGRTRLVSSDIRQERFGTAFGRYVNGSFIAARIDYNPLGVFAAPVDTLFVEGYLAPNPRDPGFHLSGFGIPLDPTSPVPRTIGTRSIFAGALDDDFFVVDGLALPASVEERRDLLTP